VAAEVSASVRRVLAALGDDRRATVFIDDVTPAALTRRAT
jgi:hypothetical protein